MQSDEIRSRFLKFFENRGHKIIPSSSLVPENDPSVLFTTAGMQQFKPYYTAPENALRDFEVKNVATVQKCIRTGDIEEVGDDTHLTFFEMLGNFSFGGYWKKEAIEYAYDFIVKELRLTIDYVSVFEGDKDTPADNESREIWQKIDSSLVVKNHNRADNFWGPTGDEGPCGPTTEIYINGVEIWNIVFNEFYKTGDGKYKPLEVKGIDTGMGLERLLVQVQKKKNVYETDLFDNEKTKEERIVTDHVKTSLFMISDGVMPSNTGGGYVLRRLIRRAVRFSKHLLAQEIDKIKKIYESVYILDDKGEIEKEESKFRETLIKGMKEFEKVASAVDEISGVDAFLLFTTYGFPFELTLELARERGLRVDEAAFKEEMRTHQKLSQTSSAGMFKGGLVDTGEETKKLHTATHLLNAALRQVLGSHVMQKGSNITAERLRFDFTHPQKMTEEEKKRVEEIVNDKIDEKLPVSFAEMPKTEAEKIAMHSFNEKYGDTVKVYSIGDEKTGYFSREFCGGPHVKNTAELYSSSREHSRDSGPFKILKEEAVAQGIRRIKAVLR